MWWCLIITLAASAKALPIANNQEAAAAATVPNGLSQTVPPPPPENGQYVFTTKPWNGEDTEGDKSMPVGDSDLDNAAVSKDVDVTFAHDGVPQHEMEKTEGETKKSEVNSDKLPNGMSAHMQDSMALHKPDDGGAAEFGSGDDDDVKLSEAFPTQVKSALNETKDKDYIPVEMPPLDTSDNMVTDGAAETAVPEIIEDSSEYKEESDKEPMPEEVETTKTPKETEPEGIAVKEAGEEMTTQSEPLVVIEHEESLHAQPMEITTEATEEKSADVSSERESSEILGGEQAEGEVTTAFETEVVVGVHTRDEPTTDAEEKDLSEVDMVTTHDGVLVPAPVAKEEASTVNYDVDKSMEIAIDVVVTSDPKDVEDVTDGEWVLTKDDEEEDEDADGKKSAVTENMLKQMTAILQKEFERQEMTTVASIATDDDEVMAGKETEGDDETDDGDTTESAEAVDGEDKDKDDEKEEAVTKASPLKESDETIIVAKEETDLRENKAEDPNKSDKELKRIKIVLKEEAMTLMPKKPLVKDDGEGGVINADKIVQPEDGFTTAGYFTDPNIGELTSGEGLSTGAKIGIAIGCIILAWILLGPLVCLLCKAKDKIEGRKKKKLQSQKQQAAEAALMEQMVLDEKASGKEKKYAAPAESEEIYKLNGNTNGVNGKSPVSA